MEAQLITSNKVSQNFNAILNQVKNQSIRFNVIQGQTIVAYIMPPPKKLLIAELDQLFATLPKLATNLSRDNIRHQRVKQL